ncbi:MAG TPA: hypothetical protein VFA50_00350 [Stellaceae bacterium]|nr:hypothetical protein [Stellaceae bacterium]
MIGSAGLKRGLMLGAVAAAIAIGASAAKPASARVFVRFGFGAPAYAPVYYPPPAVVYAYPPPAAYPPPVVVYAPPAVPYAPPPPVPQFVGAPAASTAQPYCREYQTTSAVADRLQQIVGTACRQPDGTWRIVR